MNTNDEETQEYRALRTVVGALIVALAIGVLCGLAAGKAIWKEDHEQQADRMREYFARFFAEGREFDRALASGEIVLTNERPALVTLSDLKKAGTNFSIRFEDIIPERRYVMTNMLREMGKWGGQATNSP